MIDFPKYSRKLLSYRNFLRAANGVENAWRVLPAMAMMIIISACVTPALPEDALDITNGERHTIMKARMECVQQFKTFIFHGRGYYLKKGNIVILGEGGLDNAFTATCR